VKLGLVVKYAGGAEHGPLIDLHFGMIEKHTGVPFFVYGSVDRDDARTRRIAGSRSYVRLFEPPPARSNAIEDHSNALEPLIRRAVDDGSAYVCVLHQDSFPFRSDWVRRLSEAVARPGIAFATVERIGTACLFFSRKFYTEFKPALLARDGEEHDARFSRFLAESGALAHSGTGYAYRAFQEGMRWEILGRTSTGAFCGEIYGDMIFHLGGAVRIGIRSRPARRPPAACVRFMAAVSRLARRTFTRKRWSRWTAAIQNSRWVALKERLVERPRMEYAMSRLLEDTDGYLERLRRGEE
jgi:hypothetical protein